MRGTAVVDLFGALEGSIPRDRHERAQLGVQAVDAIEVVGGEFDRRDGAGLQLLPLFEGGQLVQFSHV